MAPLIAVVGGLVQDLITVTHRIPDPGETLKSLSFTQHPGGKGANSAVAAYRLSHAREPDEHGNLVPRDDGFEVYMTGAVGDDNFGASLRATLEASNINADNVRTKKGPSAVGVILVESDYGENRILQNSGANHALTPADFQTFESLAGGRRPDLLISQMELARDTVEQIITTAAANNIEVLLNPAPPEYLLKQMYKHVKHLIVNESEATYLTGKDLKLLKEGEVEVLADADLPEPRDLGAEEAELSEYWSDIWFSAADKFLERGVENAIITLGESGAIYANRSGDRGHVKAVPVPRATDTTGAG